MKTAKILLLALLPFLTFRAFAGDTTLGYVISALPKTITLPGVYHFTRDLAYLPAAGNAITVNVGDVTIDLNGFELICNAGAANTASAIVSSQNRVAVVHGTIRGFANGVVLISNGATVRDLYLTGLFKAGIGVRGSNFNISDNRIVNTGGSTVASGTIFGISVSGTNGNVANNEVQTTYSPDIAGRGAIGINIANCSKAVVSNNRVLDVEPSASVAGAVSTGIAAPGSDNIVLLGNTVMVSAIGFDFTTTTSAKYGDNVTSSVTTPYSAGAGATSIGNNN